MEAHGTNDNREARHWVAVCMLLQLRLYYGDGRAQGTRDEHTIAMNLIDEILGRVKIDNLSSIVDDAIEMLPDFDARDLEIATLMCQSYCAGTDANDLWQCVPADMVANDDDEDDEYGSEIGDERDIDLFSRGRRYAGDGGRTPHESGSDENGMGHCFAVIWHGDAESSTWGHGLRGGCGSDGGINREMLQAVGAFPLHYCIEPPNPEVQNIVKTTQVLLTGHRLEYQFNFRRRIAEWAVYAPYALPFEQSIAHGRFLLPDKFAADEAFFNRQSERILGIVRKSLEATFPLYQRNPAFG